MLTLLLLSALSLPVYAEEASTNIETQVQQDQKDTQTEIVKIEGVVEKSLQSFQSELNKVQQDSQKYTKESIEAFSKELDKKLDTIISRIDKLEKEVATLAN